METLQKSVVDDLLSTFARLLLFVVDELEPLNEATLDEDLKRLDLAIASIERCAQRWRAKRSQN